MRDLLDHMSGLNDYFFHPKIDAALLADPGRKWSAADALGTSASRTSRPGRGYHYSNTNYLVLGMLAEAVGGAPIAEQLHARFLDPLGLTGTIYQGAEPSTAAPAHGYRFTGASVEASRDRPDREILDRAVPVGRHRGRSGGFDRHDGPDLVHWARALYGGDALSEPDLRAMLGDVESDDGLRRAAYGLGVQSVAPRRATDIRPLGPTSWLAGGLPLASRPSRCRSQF